MRSRLTSIIVSTIKMIFYCDCENNYGYYHHCCSSSYSYSSYVHVLSLRRILALILFSLVLNLILFLIVISLLLYSSFLLLLLPVLLVWQPAWSDFVLFQEDTLTHIRDPTII